MCKGIFPENKVWDSIRQAIILCRGASPEKLAFVICIFETGNLEGMLGCTGISMTCQYNVLFSSLFPFFNLFIFLIPSLFVKADLDASCKLIYVVRDRRKRSLCLHIILKELSKMLFSSRTELWESGCYRRQ